jgi:hypothetical protein
MRGNSMNTITLSAVREQRKAGRAMEIRTYQEGDHARLKPILETGRIIVTVGRVVYVLMDGPNTSEFFAAYVEKDAYSIELVPPEDTTDVGLSV